MTARAAFMALVALAALAGFVYLVAFTVGHPFAEIGLFVVAYEACERMYVSTKDQNNSELEDMT